MNEKTVKEHKKNAENLKKNLGLHL